MLDQLHQIVHPSLKLAFDFIDGHGRYSRTRNGCEYFHTWHRQTGEGWLVFGFNNPLRLMMRKASDGKHSFDFIQEIDPILAAKRLGVVVHTNDLTEKHYAELTDVLSQAASTEQGGIKPGLVYRLVGRGGVLQRALARREWLATRKKLGL